jgi:hypothetical protein
MKRVKGPVSEYSPAISLQLSKKILTVVDALAVWLYYATPKQLEKERERLKPVGGEGLIIFKQEEISSKRQQRVPLNQR